MLISKRNIQQLRRQEVQERPNLSSMSALKSGTKFPGVRIVPVPTNLPPARASNSSPGSPAVVASNPPISPADNDSKPEMMPASVPAEPTAIPTNTYVMVNAGTFTRPSLPGQTENEIARMEYDDTDDMDMAVDGVLVYEIDTPVVNTQDLSRVAQASGESDDTPNAGSEMFPLSTALALEIIIAAVGAIGLGLFVFWYIKRLRRRRRMNKTASEKDMDNFGGPAKPQSGYRMTISSLASSLRGHNDAARSSRGPGVFNTNKEKSTWAVFSKPAGDEPVELPDISTCPNAYTNDTQTGAGGRSNQEEIRIGLRPVEVNESSSESPTLAREPSRSSSVMIMYVKSWLPGTSSSDNGRYSARSSSAFRKGSIQSNAQRDAVSPYESSLDDNSNNYAQTWQQQQQYQQQQQRQLEFSSVDERSVAPPVALYTSKDMRLSWTSTAESDYSLAGPDDVSAMTNTTSRISAPRIPHPPDAHRYI